MTPAQEARQYAEANGFTIVAVGRRYKCTHTASGTTFERGGYVALLNEMRFVVGTLKDAPVQNVTQKLIEIGKLSIDGIIPNIADGAMIDTLMNVNATYGKLVLPRKGWVVVGFDVPYFPIRANRSEALKDLRRLMSNPQTRPKHPMIIYTGV